MNKPVIGFIGIGLMGHGIAKNILEAGYPLVTMAHRKRAPLEDLVARGATEAGNVADLARQSDILFLCVTGSPQIEALVRGPEGIAANAKPGSVLVDCSTADPTSTETLAAELAEKGIAMADAPLGGTPAQAEEGKLSAIVGADPKTFARIEPVLKTWAANVLLLGPVGQGHKMKLINNFISLGQAALLAEGMAMARRAGLSIEQFHTVIGSSRMRNGFYDTFMKWTLEGDEAAHQFTISNAHKDMRYLASLAVATGAVTPVQAVLRNDLAAMEAAGQGARFVPMLADFIASVNGLDPAQEA